MKTIINLIIISFLFIACEQVVEMDIPDRGRKIVVNSKINTDSIFKVNISKSSYIKYNDIAFLDNATVEILENNNTIDTLIYIFDGMYKSGSFIPTAGNTYNIEVTVPNMETVTAETEMPNKVEILKVDTLTVYKYDEINGYKEELLEWHVKFNDPANVKNYYLISADITETYTYDSIENTYRQSMYLESDDPAIELNEGQYLVFSDNLFDGNTKEIILSDNTYFYDTAYVNFNLSAISEDYYLYLITYAKHLDAQWDPFAESVQVHNNIENGFGIFAAVNNSVSDTIVIYGKDYYYDYYE